APLVILLVGGFALVRRWIQTPSVAKVRSATMRRGRSSSELPLRPAFSVHGKGGPVGMKTRARAKPARALGGSASDASAARPVIAWRADPGRRGDGALWSVGPR